MILLVHYITHTLTFDSIKKSRIGIDSQDKRVDIFGGLSSRVDTKHPSLHYGRHFRITLYIIICLE